MVWGQGGFLAEIGSVDFAGGNVVHISSGVSALIFAIILGRRKGYENTAYRIHNIPFVALGAFILWFGWFGFNKVIIPQQIGLTSAPMINADQIGTKPAPGVIATSPTTALPDGMDCSSETITFLLHS